MLLAVVAIAARGRPLDSSGGGRGGLPLAFWDYTLTTVLIVAAVALIAFLVVATLFVRKSPGKPRDYFQRHMLRTIAGFTLVAMLGIVLARHHAFSHFHLPPEQVQLSPTHPGAGGHAGTATRAPRLRWNEVAIVLGLFLVVAAIVGTLRAARGPRLFRPQPAGPETLAAALDLSLDDLRTDPDLRRAIIAAYARMEAALAVAGIPRHPSEAPLEYVERALRTLHASAGAVRRLTDLFEWARFSDHEPEPSMRDDAVDALIAVRDEVRASELVPA